MMAGPDGETHVGGGPARHIPVLLPEVLAAIGPAEGRIVVDGTFGAGGYTSALLERGASVVAIDRDVDAVSAGAALAGQWGERLRLVEGRFSELDSISGTQVDGVVLDLGVSSMQLDTPGRGFSFRHDGPLDMRMGGEGASAADIVNTMKTADLARIFTVLGEERHARRVARMIERRRAERAFETTRDLAEAVAAVVGHHPRVKIHPATRVFQALRIFVNDELGELARALFAAERALAPGGRLAVVTFHSLEDRIVKRFLAARSGGTGGSRHLPEASPGPLTFDRPDRSLTPSQSEAGRNPRARSARLRAARRTGEPAAAEDLSVLGLPRLPGPQGRETT